MNRPSDLTSFTLLTDAVLVEFPHTSTSDVRAAIRHKCNKSNYFIELPYFLEMYHLKLFCIVLYCFCFVLLYLFYMLEIKSQLKKQKTKSEVCVLLLLQNVIILFVSLGVLFI